LAPFWVARVYWGEARRWIEGLLARSSEVPPAVRATALAYAADLQWRLGDYQQGLEPAEESVELFRAVGDTWGHGFALSMLGHIEEVRGNPGGARRHFEEALACFRQAGNQVWAAWMLWDLGRVANRQGDQMRARCHFEESLALFRPTGYQRGIAYALLTAGEVALAQHDATRAAALYQESQMLFRELRDPAGVARVLSGLGQVAQAQEEYHQAARLYDESVQRAREQEQKDIVPEGLIDLGHLARVQGDDMRARECYQESLRLIRAIGGLSRQYMTGCLQGMAALANRTQTPERAATLFGAAEALAAYGPTPATLVSHPAYTRDVAATRAQLDEAAFEAAWAEGRAMTLDQAIAYALEDRG
jgi:tetratricopeptide (TPR) repeat protein